MKRETNKEKEINLFEDELKKTNIDKKGYISFKKAVNIKLLDENNEPRINFLHIPTMFNLDSYKKGYLTIEDYILLSEVVISKEKQFKRYELNSKLIAVFNINMLRQVCSEIGEYQFVSWVIRFLRIVEYEMKHDEDNLTLSHILNESYSDILYLSKETILLFYLIFNINFSFNLTFEGFFEMLLQSDLELDQYSNIPHDNEPLTGNDDINCCSGSANRDFLVSVNLIQSFSTNYIRGFCKLIIDIGYDELIVNYEEE